MTDEKVTEVLDRYERILDAFANDPEVMHMRTMIPKMRVFLITGQSAKLMRWLGFIQGAFWATHAFTLEELKAHNMPVPDE